MLRHIRCAPSVAHGEIVSIGVTVASILHRDSFDVVRRADVSLFRATGEGGGGGTRFSAAKRTSEKRHK